MRRINWKKIRINIPSKVVINKTAYEVLWTQEFPDVSVVGEKRGHIPQIVLKLGETDKETVHTFIHEVLHAWADEYEAKVTETQVQKLEKGTADILRIFGELYEKTKN